MPNSWTMLHVFFPLLPFILGGFVRIGTSLDIRWETFSASDLAICLALLSLFVSQSIAAKEPVLDSPDKIAERKTQVYIFLAFGLFLAVLFALTTTFDELVFEKGYSNLTDSLRFFQTVTFIALFYMLWLARRTQRSFRLEGWIW